MTASLDVRRITLARRLTASVAASAWLAFASPIAMLAASPSPSGPGGDTRSTGEGPGLVGEPLIAIGLVVLIAAISVLLTIAYVRVTADRAGTRRGGD